MAELGEHFYYGIAGIQLTLALLAAPAATAGSVCIDRARGWLAHMFVTELSDAEIVLGKLAARFASILTLVLTGLPVLAISALLGGIIPEALVLLTVVTLAVSLLGCSLALALSVRASKTHEVLMLVFTLWTGWLLSYPVWYGVARSAGLAAPPDWFAKLNPFVLVYAPYVWPRYIDANDVAMFVAVTLTISFAVLIVATRRLRKDLPPLGQRSERLEILRNAIQTHLFSWWPSPSLDGNPVLWREWHRNRPSRMARLVTTLFIVTTVLTMSLGMAEAVLHGVGIPMRF